MPSPKRIRRSPEEARQLILDAAGRVFLEAGPGKTTLKSVGRAAGVSHALVTHYFGTIDALVEAVMETRMRQLRQELLAAVALSREEGIEHAIDAVVPVLTDPVQSKLMAWAFLSGSARSESFFATRVKGMKQLVDAFAEQHPLCPRTRERIESLMVLLWCAAAGYGAAAPVLWGSLGRPHDAAADAQFRSLLRELLSQVVGDAMAQSSPT